MALNPAPVVRRVITYPTPVISDVIFYEMRESRLPVYQTPPVYGTPHPDINKYPKHKLVHVTAMDEGGWQRWYYAADRSMAEQDIYNYTLRDGEEFTRTYVVPRNSIPAAPEGGSFDPVFQDYAFVGQTVKSADEPLAGLYAIVYRRFIQWQTEAIQYDSRLDCMVRTTKRVVKIGGYDVDDVNYASWRPRADAGVAVELQPGNTVHDVLIKQEVINPTGGTSLEWSLPSTPTFVDYKFPARLDAMKLIYRYAYIASGGGLPAYDEDYYFDFKFTEAIPGPYAAVTTRTVTDDPANLMASLNLNVIPSPKRETVGIAYSWYASSAEGGNKAVAFAKEIVIPASLHTAITIEGIGAPPSSGAGIIANRNAYSTTALEATPGFPSGGNYTSASHPNGIDIAASVRQLPLGLYEVSVTNIQFPTTGIYYEPPV